jgi:hypothetical protein
MKLRIILLTVAIATVSVSASAQTRAIQPIVHSGLYVMRDDGKVGGSAVQTGEYVGAELDGTLYLSPCSGIGASGSGRPVSAFATDVWAMSGKVLDLNDQQASVQLGWRRIRRAGQVENSPEQSTTLTLKRGERHTIETITVPASGSCNARTVLLGVVFASGTELYGITDADYARGGGRASSASAGGGRPYVQGSHQRTNDGGTAISVGSGGGASNPALRRLSADLWLVRSTPGAADQTLHVTSPLTPIPLQYAFAPLTIQAAHGTLSVTVEGTLEAGLSPEGEQRLHFTASRRVTTVTSSRPTRDGSAIVEGSTKTTLKLPAPDEVLSFELPPLRTADGVILPDRFSIRVRVGAPSGR